MITAIHDSRLTMTAMRIVTVTWMGKRENSSPLPSCPMTNLDTFGVDIADCLSCDEEVSRDEREKNCPGRPWCNGKEGRKG